MCTHARQPCGADILMSIRRKKADLGRTRGTKKRQLMDSENRMDSQTYRKCSRGRKEVRWGKEIHGHSVESIRTGQDELEISGICLYPAVDLE